MGISRRDFLQMLSSGAIMAALPTPVRAFESEVFDSHSGWQKAPCRFCGVGCGVQLHVKNGRIAAVVGDRRSPVNKGLLCIKGYSLPGILYGEDRLTTPLIRTPRGLVEASWEDALDLIAAKFGETLAERGPEGIAVYGSGQWTITDGYAALKWVKGGMGSNNLEANARLCMASAVTGLITTFGADGLMGCYEDFDLCDAAVLWGNNMAEMHPVLFSRLLENKRQHPHVKIVDLGTRQTPTTPFCDLFAEFRPQSDLALANGIAHLIIKRCQHDAEFIRDHVVFSAGEQDIGYGLQDGFRFKDQARGATFEEYVDFVADYTPENVSQISGLPVEKIEQLADIYSSPETKVVSLWCMGVNQHTRGTWMNNLIYNLHLLTGKIGRPGSTPFSLTGQPSACGTVREVGTLTHRLPADMVVMDAQHRALAGEIWGIPASQINPKPSFHTMEMFRALDRGVIRAMWIQVTNPFVSLPNVNRYREGALKEDRFIVVSDVYPTPTTEVADVVLPSAMWVEREGVFGNSERRTQQWERIVAPPDGCLPDDWQMIEVARRMGYQHLFSYERQTYVRDLYEEYRRFTLGSGMDLGRYGDLRKTRGLRWPVVDGKETQRRYVEGSDPYVKPGEGLKFYKNEKHDGKAVIWLRPYEPAAEEPDDQYPFWLCTGRVLEHWHTGSMTRRVPQLHRAQPAAYVEINPDDARRLGVNDGDTVRLASRRGEVSLPCKFDGKGKVPKGVVFVPFFDEDRIINKLTLDAYCPISAQPDYKKCAVKVERA